MTDTYAVGTSPFARTSTAEPSMASNTLSALLIVGLPTLFWMAMLEVANVVFGLGFGMTTRLVVGGGLVAVLSVVWCFAVLSARQTKAGDKLEKNLERIERTPPSERP